METLYLALASVVVIAIVSIIRASIRPAKFPPGPLCLPLVGYLPFLQARNIGRSFRSLSKRYGDLFSIHVGSKPIVVLNSWSLMREALAKREFAGRPNIFSGTFFQKGKTGICTTEGEVWESQRDFLLKHITDMTQGNASRGFQEVVLDEIEDLKLDLSKKLGEPVSVGYNLKVAVINILWTIASGRKLHSQQQEFLSVYECIDKINGFMSRAAIMSFVPGLSRVVPEFISKMKRGRYYRDRFVSISEKWIKEHKEEYRGNRTGDMQDAYLEKVLEHGDEMFTEKNLGAMLREIFVLGAESESVMLNWSMRILSVHRDAQRKVQDEIDRVVGDKSVVWSDREELPYTMATLAEIQRFADIVPSGIPHKVMCDVEFHGYTLPEGTSVLANINACHRNSKYWQHPDTFHPEHFLDGEGKFITCKEGFVPFGTGVRRCPAEDLTRMTLFMILTHLLQHFSFRTPPNDDGKIGTFYEAGTTFLRNPRPYYVVIHARK